MNKLLASLFAFGLVLSVSKPACAQDFGGGGISIGPGGPVASFSGGQVGTGVGSFTAGPNGFSGGFSGNGFGVSGGSFNGGGYGNVNVGSGGTFAGGSFNTGNTGGSNFGFDVGGNNATSTPNMMSDVNGVGPQGQTAMGSQTGVDPTSGVANSQGATGQQVGNTSNQTLGNWYGKSQKTHKNNTQLQEVSRYNLLSNFSVNPAPVPSGSFSYGFTGGGYSTMGTQYLMNGWYLPPTSTSSNDLNIVSP